MKRKSKTANVLRTEIDCMIECFTKELFSTFDKKDILGIYLLGSVNKPWDSDIDYIPRFSDVDINIYFKNPEIFNKYFSNMGNALKFSKNYEDRYLKKVPNPHHIPKMQAQLHNMFLKNPDYLPPVNTVRTLYGVKYFKRISHKSKNLRSRILEQESFIKGIPVRVMSADAEKLIKYMHEFYWRVSSAIPVILCIKGESQENIMGLNKSSVIKMLKTKGYRTLSTNYESMLKNALKYFQKNDTENARQAILFGYKVLVECLKIVKLD